MIAHEIAKPELGPMTLLGSGGQGRVYDVPHLTLSGETGPFVYKEYKERVLAKHESALRHSVHRLVAVRLGATGRAERLDMVTTWPLAVVLPAADAVGACGIVMKRYPVTCFVPIRLPSGTVKNVEFSCNQYLRPEVDRAALGLPAMTDMERWRFLIKVGLLLCRLHDNEVVFGDLSGKNILINTVGSASPRDYRPMFIDTDGCRIRGQQVALRQLNTPSWEPPEIRRALDDAQAARRSHGSDSATVYKADLRSQHATMATDVYKFGLLIERFMHKGVASGGDVPRPGHSGPSNVRVSVEARRAMLALGMTTARLEVVRGTHNPDPERRPTMAHVVEAMMGQPLVRRG